jgi:succinoglycan biosynthesis protein ExoM
MTKQTNHICVCICTYKRADLLKHALKELRGQETMGFFTYSIVVADNDHLQSAHSLVSEFATQSQIPISYCVEPRQNIALARNRAVENANGDFIAFLDDDEFPTKRWLLTLFVACEKYNVDGVLGPVKPHFDEKPPTWVVKGKFYDRQTYPTGSVIDGKKGRTGNVLLKKRVFDAAGVEPFKPQHCTGEDQEFFGRMIEKGHVFIWCDEAVVYETVPPVRWKRTFIIKRTLLQGALSLLDRDFGALQVVKSAAAVPIYISVLPLALLMGHHRFMTCAHKLSYHVGRLLAVIGIKPINVPYVTE